MNTQVAAIPFMLRHELRLHWRLLGFKMRAGLALAAMLAVLHLIALPIAFVLGEFPQVPRVSLLLAVSIAFVGLLLTLVSTGLVAVMKVIYERRDFDLLLSSPIDPHAVVVSRTLGMAAAGIGLCIVLVGPFANMLALFGNAQYLALYPVVIGIGLLAASVSLLLAEGLFRAVGARRARILAQVMALAIAGVTVVAVNLQYLMENVSGRAFDTLQTVATAMPGADSWIWLPARAALGEPLPLAAFMLLALGLFILTTFGLANSFLSNARSAAGEATVRVPAAGAMRPFRGGARGVMLHKELRLLARDPYLLAQVLYQVIGVVPVVFMLWKGSASWPALPWVSLVLIAGVTAANLAWITVAAEDSPDLLAVAPVSRRAVLRAKLEAALLPVGALIALPILIATTLDPWLGLTLVVCCIGAALSTALINQRFAKPGKRSEFNKRVQSSWLAWLLEFAVAAAWTGAAALMLISSYIAPFAVLGVLALTAVSLRR